MKRRELEQGIQDAFDGGLDDARAAALRKELLASPGALDLYCDQALLESELRRHATGRRKVPGAVSARTAVAAGVRRRKQVWVSLGAAAALLLVTGIVLSLVFIAPAPPLAKLQLSPGSVLTTADGAEFRGAELNEGESLVLGQGVARMVFESGVEAVVEGPAAMKLVAADRLDLRAGHSWFRVPEKARGFRVVSPQMEVIDLGTEFGVDLREDLPPQVHVMDGKVEARSLRGSRRSQTLGAGEAVTLTPSGRWEPVQFVPGKFRDSLPRALPELAMDFDSPDGDELPLEGDMLGVENATALLRGGSGARFVPGIKGNALEFSGTGAFIESSWPGISGTAPRTISLWCRVPAGAKPETAPPLALWGNPALGWNRKFKVALAPGPDGKAVLRASFGNTYYDGGTALSDGEWHHLAVVYKGNDFDGLPLLELYVDGIPEELGRVVDAGTGIQTDTGSEGSLGLSIGRYELPAGGRNIFLNAALDEFRIFAGVLREDEIRVLAGER